MGKRQHPELLMMNAADRLRRLFVMPPFSILDAMSSDWSHRKKRWLALGLQSDLGRGATIDDGRKLPPGGGGRGSWIGSKPSKSTHKYRKVHNAIPGSGGPMLIDRARNSSIPYSNSFVGTKNKKAVEKSTSYKNQDRLWGAMDPGRKRSTEDDQLSGTSIFDPVLCEIMLRWFAGKNSKVFDPFAGGSVRGVVSALLGHRYTGIDLRREQVAANAQQWVDVLEACGKPPLCVPDNIGEPDWYEGDSVKVLKTAKPERMDFVLTCPPYTFLEQYSDDPRDLSTMSYVDFLKRYRYVIRKCARMLRPDRFACFVVGDVRDHKNHGIYVNFVGDTITAFMDAGMGLYNHAILATAIGSLPIRVGPYMNSSAKLGPRHQHVLIFVKGDPVAAHKAMPFNTVSLPCLVSQTDVDRGHTGFGYKPRG